MEKIWIYHSAFFIKKKHWVCFKQKNICFLEKNLDIFDIYMTLYQKTETWRREMTHSRDMELFHHFWEIFLLIQPPKNHKNVEKTKEKQICHWKSPYIWHGGLVMFGNAGPVAWKMHYIWGMGDTKRRRPRRSGRPCLRKGPEWRSWGFQCDQRF